MVHKDTVPLQKKDVSYTDCELERMFGLWNSTIWDISDWIQVAGNHRSTMILNKLYKAFFHCDAFLNWAYRPNRSVTFMLVLENEFERGLYLHGEGYDTNANYDLPQPPNKSTCIYAVPLVAELSFDSMGY